MIENPAENLVENLVEEVRALVGDKGGFFTRGCSIFHLPEFGTYQICFDTQNGTEDIFFLDPDKLTIYKNSLIYGFKASIGHVKQPMDKSAAELRNRLAGISFSA